jgi:hypothetical protein
VHSEIAAETSGVPIFGFLLLPRPPLFIGFIGTPSSQAKLEVKKREVISGLDRASDGVSDVIVPVSRMGDLIAPAALHGTFERANLVDLRIEQRQERIIIKLGFVLFDNCNNEGERLNERGPQQASDRTLCGEHSVAGH